MEQVLDDVRELGAVYSRQPLPEILSRLASTQDIVFTLLEARQVPAHARQLYFLAGVVGGLLARASHDLADPYAALTQARTAFICADRADHNGLRAWIRALQSMITYWADRPYESVRYAQSGTEFAAAAHNTTAVWLPAVEARAWAQLGNADRVCELIERAQQMRHQVQPDDLDDLGGICTFGGSRQLYCAADALAWLPEQAVTCQRYAEQAVEAYRDTSIPDWSFSFQAGSHADLAIARISSGELDGAAEALAPVLELPAERRTNPIIRSMQRVNTALGSRSLAGGSRTLKEEIQAFTDTSARALPHQTWSA
jgi:hypothetical protein